MSRLVVWHLTFFSNSRATGLSLSSSAKQAFLTPFKQTFKGCQARYQPIDSEIGFCDLTSAGFQRKTELSITLGSDGVKLKSKIKVSRCEGEPGAIFICVRPHSLHMYGSFRGESFEYSIQLSLHMRRFPMQNSSIGMEKEMALKVCLGSISGGRP